MNCTEFNLKFNEFVETRQSIAESQLRDHARDCTSCGQVWLRHFVLDRSISAWRSEEMDVELTVSILRQLEWDNIEDKSDSVEKLKSPLKIEQSSSTPTESTRSTAAWILVALAASVLVMINLVFQSPINSTPENDQSLHASNFEVQALFDDADLAWQSLTEEAAISASDVAILWPSLGNEDLSTQQPQPEENWVDDWKQNLKPIRDDVKQAVDFLKNVIPFETDPTT